MLLPDFLKDKIERKNFFKIDRFSRIFGSKNFKKAPLAIQLIGTNGKGSTGRFLACALSFFGKKVFHFTSPHIHKINERFWLNGCEISDSKLEYAHNSVIAMLDDNEKLAISYFEYCTLLAAHIAKDFDVAIFEAGMGGEFDATSSLDIDLTIATCIDIDHTETLGESIEKIALTKLKATQKKLLIGEQTFKSQVWYAINFLNPKLQIYDYLAWLGDDDTKLAMQSCKSLNIATSPFVGNLALAISALRLLGYEPQLECFLNFDLKARTQKLNDTIWLDAGHNTGAAKAIAKNFAPKSMRLVFGCASDKDGLAMLCELAPIACFVEFFEYDSLRKTPKSQLIKYAQDIKLDVKEYDKHSGMPTLVFGSFELIDAFLKEYNAKR
jgi:dihydrofolate synthase/folylpolyglutamate synthase